MYVSLAQRRIIVIKLQSSHVMNKKATNCRPV